MATTSSDSLTGLVIRVDDRLFHGQILYGWAASWADEVWLADDRVANDPDERALYLDLIRKVGGGILTVDEAVARYRSGKCSELGKHCLLILGSCADLKRLIDGGARPAEIHLANLGEEPGRIHVAETINLSAGDCRILHQLKDDGFPVCLRKLPSSKTRDLVLPEL